METSPSGWDHGGVVYDDEFSVSQQQQLFSERRKVLADNMYNLIRDNA
jgi:hypothetical protein